MSSLLYGFLFTFGGILGIILAVILLGLLYKNLPALLSRPAIATPAATATAVTATTATATTTTGWGFPKWSTVLFLVVLLAVGLATFLYPSLVLDVIWWEPSLPILLEVLVIGFILFRLAPASDKWQIKLVKAIVVALTVWYLFRAVSPTGFGVWLKETTNAVGECFRTPDCLSSDGPVVYPSGKTIWIHHYATKENRQIFRFKGKVTLYNNKACSIPRIEKFDGLDDLTIIKDPVNQHHTYLEAPRDKTIEVQVWLKPNPACVKQ